MRLYDQFGRLTKDPMAALWCSDYVRTKVREQLASKPFASTFQPSLYDADGEPWSSGSRIARWVLPDAP